MKKKGVEMSLNVIIVAAIGLLILVILAFLVINYVGKTQKGLESCNLKGGTCESTCTTSTGTRDIIPQTDCSSRTDGKTSCCKVLTGA